MRVTTVREEIGIAVVGPAAVHAQGELVGLVGLRDVDGELDDVVAPDLRAVVADQHVVGDAGGEVERLGGPGAAQSGGQIGGGRYLRR